MPPSSRSSLCSFFTIDFSHPVSSIIIRDGVRYSPGLYRASGRRKRNRKRVKRGTRWKKRDWGMKGTNDCRFAGGFWCPRDAALWLFMLLIHKFPVNSARMSERPPFCTLTYPRCHRSAPRRRDFFFGLLPLLFLSFIPFPLDFRIPDPSDLRPILILLRDRSYVYKSVTGRGGDRRRNFRIYWSHSRLLSALLRLWLVPTSSRERYSILPAAGGVSYKSPPSPLGGETVRLVTRIIE